MIYTAINPQRPALEAASGEGLLAGEQKRSLQIEGAAAAAAVYSSRGLHSPWQRVLLFSPQTQDLIPYFSSNAESITAV